LSDEELLSRFLAGNEDAFTELMRRHEDRVFALAMRMTGNRADALDATQETFIQAFRKAARFRGDSAFGTWLWRIGINACNDVLRKRKRAPVPEEEPPEEQSVGDSTAIDESVVTRLELRDALAELSDDYREAVAMHDLGGIPYEEIAQLTGVSIGTVKSRISRGRKRLAHLLEQGSTPRTSKDSR
ncbi:MAG TPA: sigma-70 family RNA polymerase sigma factor, partial [Actinomycetota bacterium]|nr:sigma-70 family RNA polymerase sigma factor [Actinomycetota bacterium]